MNFFTRSMPIHLSVLLLLTSLSSVVPAASSQDPPTPNDFNTYGANFSSVLYFIRNGQIWKQNVRAITITTGNPNFDLNHARTHSGNKVNHIHFEVNYGAVGGATVAEGNAFWNYYYGSSD